MDPRTQKLFENDVRSYLIRIALELESSAEGARAAAKAMPDSKATWAPVQQMYARFAQATRLLDEFRATIDKAISNP